jgi:hypothetical protein
MQEKRTPETASAGSHAARGSNAAISPDAYAATSSNAYATYTSDAHATISSVANAKAYDHGTDKDSHTGQC